MNDIVNTIQQYLRNFPSHLKHFPDNAYLAAFVLALVSLALLKSKPLAGLVAIIVAAILVLLGLSDGGPFKA